MKRNLILALGLAAAALSAAGCSGNKKSSAEAGEQAVAVRTAVASGEVLPRNVEFTATIEPWQKNYIIPALQGARIYRIYVDVGDRVRRGQLVAEMDPTQYNQARVSFATAEADYRRVKSVYEAGGISAQQLQLAETQYLISKETVENLEKNVRLLSPIDGVVTQRFEEEGNLFTSSPILEIMQIDRLKVKVNVSEQFFPNVGVGTPAVISADVFPGETFPGSVCLIYPAIDPATRTFTVEIAIPNTGMRLRPGMFARCVMNMGDAESVMVPDVAVQKQVGTNERFVYVIADGRAERRFVNAGRTIGSRIDIIGGLKPGETVATTSFTRLDEGTKVEIVNE